MNTPSIEQTRQVKVSGLGASHSALANPILPVLGRLGNGLGLSLVCGSVWPSHLDNLWILAPFLLTHLFGVMSTIAAVRQLVAIRHGYAFSGTLSPIDQTLRMA